jgi:hypothetical protein
MSMRVSMVIGIVIAALVSASTEAGVSEPAIVWQFEAGG